MAEPTPIQKSDDPRRDWRQINALMERNKALEAAVGALNGAVNELRHNQKIRQAGEGGGTVEQFRFKSMDADKINCARWDGAAEGAIVAIWKPYKLRRTPFADKSVTYFLERSPGTLVVTYTYLSHTKRRAASPSGTEEQFITPLYRLDDLIYAIRCPQLDSEYLDLNVDARAWAEFS